MTGTYAAITLSNRTTKTHPRLTADYERKVTSDPWCAGGAQIAQFGEAEVSRHPMKLVRYQAAFALL